MQFIQSASRVQVRVKDSLCCITTKNLLSQSQQRTRDIFLCTWRPSGSGAEIQSAACQSLIRPGTKTERENKTAAEACLRPIELSGSATPSRADKDGGILTTQVHSWCKSNVRCCNKSTRWLKKKKKNEDGVISQPLTPDAIQDTPNAWSLSNLCIDVIVVSSHSMEVSFCFQ